MKNNNNNLSTPKVPIINIMIKFQSINVSIIFLLYNFYLIPFINSFAPSSQTICFSNKNILHQVLLSRPLLPLSPPSSSYHSSTTSLQVIPEPGPCPKCSDENGYWDGSTNFVCIACGEEWPVESAEADNNNNDGIVRDCNGNILESGDAVTLTKELGKGLKQGLKVTRIRVGDYGDGHDVEANIPGLGTFALKSMYLKKSNK